MDELLQNSGRKADTQADRHFTLWATAAQYAWSTLLVQPWFVRSQAKYETALRANEDIARTMKGYEGTLVEQLNRLAMVLDCDGKVEDERGKDGYRTLQPMMYFEHLFLFPPCETVGGDPQKPVAVLSAHFASWTHFCRAHFHFPSACLPSTDCRSILLPTLPGITSPMVYVSPGYTAFPWHKEDLSLRSSFCVLDGAPKLLFTVPVQHEAAFSAFIRSRSPAGAHPLFHRSKSMLLIPGPALLERFDMEVRLCGVGQAVIIGRNVWHAGINLGANSSISVNIVGAGGVEEFRADLLAMVDDLRELQKVLRDFRAEREGEMKDGEGEEGEEEGMEWKRRWTAAWKLFTGQALIFNRFRDANVCGRWNPLRDPAILPPLQVPLASSPAAVDAFLDAPLPIQVPSVEALAECIQERGQPLASHRCPH